MFLFSFNNIGYIGYNLTFLLFWTILGLLGLTILFYLLISLRSNDYVVFYLIHLMFDNDVNIKATTPFGIVAYRNDMCCTVTVLRLRVVAERVLTFCGAWLR